MKELKINNWDEFEKKVEEVYQYAEGLKTDRSIYISRPLFRGQSNSQWNLESTLDRIVPDSSVRDYLQIIRRIQSSIESLTLKKWNFSDIEKELEKLDMDHFSMECYEYLTHLRHHHFPSPLLDWTQSPYIAAFFAFNTAKSDVAIFMYIEHLGKGKTYWGENTRICSMGPNVTTHKRHHLQQCEYTFCIKEYNNNAIYFSNYEDALKLNNNEQDLIEKYILPLSEKEKFLAKLNLMNINAYSLFESEESLMNKLANEQFIINKLVRKAGSEEHKQVTSISYRWQ